MSVLISFFILFVGFICGLFLYKNTSVIRIVPKVLHYIVYILLFFLGVELGSSENFIANILVVGKQAFIISLCCLLGASIASVFVWKVFFKSSKE